METFLRRNNKSHAGRAMDVGRRFFMVKTSDPNAAANHFSLYC